MDLDQYNRVDLEHIIERWRPVVEAARACVPDIRFLINTRASGPREERAVALAVAVEALERAEGE
jgi:hypothetical protein